MFLHDTLGLQQMLGLSCSSLVLTKLVLIASSMSLLPERGLVSGVIFWLGFLAPLAVALLVSSNRLQDRGLGG